MYFKLSYRKYTQAGQKEYIFIYFKSKRILYKQTITLAHLFSLQKVIWPGFNEVVLFV